MYLANSRIATSFVLLLVMFGITVADLSDSTLTLWAKENAWANDSLAMVTPTTVEIHRDLSDLWMATRAYRTPGMFWELTLFHGFTWVGGDFSAKLFSDFHQIQKIRMVMWVRKSTKNPLSIVGKIRINRSTYATPRFRALMDTAQKNPTRFLELSLERFDGVWLNREFARK